MKSIDVYADIIRSSVTAADVARQFGLEVDRHHRCACPFHNGKDKNMRLYDGDRGFYCFVCHEGGDVFRLTRELLGGATFAEAAKWLNEEFGLRLDIGKDLAPERLREAQERRKKAQEEQEFRRWKEWAAYELYLTAGDLLGRYEEQRDANTPTDPDEEWNDAFCEALTMIPETKALADEAWDLLTTLKR